MSAFDQLRAWIFDDTRARDLPARVRRSLAEQRERSEILIGWIQFAIVIFLASVFELAPMAQGVVQANYALEAEALVGYGAFCALRLVLAHRRRLAEWMLYLSVVVDIALLMFLIYSFHLKYDQSAAFVLKVPTLFYCFLFIALRALRFDA